MKVKRIIKIAVDLSMFILLTLLMGEHLISEAVHEWIGVAVFVLFIVHIVLNYRWYATLFKGRYTAKRIVQTVINFLLLMAILLCIISSLFVSGNVFAFLNLNNGHLGRILHLIITAWVYILCALHLGFHWNGFVALGTKINMSHAVKTVIVWVLRFAVLGICAYGLYVFIDRAFYEELFLLTEFKFFDYEKTVFVYFFESTSMAVAFITATYYIHKLIYIRKKKKSKEIQNG